MTWTDERVETLKRLWTDGLSASQIAAELGGITRNAVIGKVHRLGLSGRAKSPSSAAPRPRKARPHQHMMRVSRPAVRGNTALAHAYDLDAEAEPELGRQRHSHGSAPDLARIDRGDLPLADRRSRPGRLLLLRRADDHHPALLRLSLARRLSAAQHAPRPAAVPRLTGPSFVMPGLDPGIHLLCEKASCEDDGLQRTRAARVRNIHVPQVG